MNPYDLLVLEMFHYSYCSKQVVPDILEAMSYEKKALLKNPWLSQIGGSVTDPRVKARSALDTKPQAGSPTLPQPSKRKAMQDPRNDLLQKPKVDRTAGPHEPVGDLHLIAKELFTDNQISRRGLVKYATAHGIPASTAYAAIQSGQEGEFPDVVAFFRAHRIHPSKRPVMGKLFNAGRIMAHGHKALELLAGAAGRVATHGVVTTKTGPELVKKGTSPEVEGILSTLKNSLLSHGLGTEAANVIVNRVERIHDARKEAAARKAQREAAKPDLPAIAGDVKIERSKSLPHLAAMKTIPDDPKRLAVPGTDRTITASHKSLVIPGNWMKINGMDAAVSLEFKRENVEELVRHLQKAADRNDPGSKWGYDDEKNKLTLETPHAFVSFSYDPKYTNAWMIPFASMKKDFADAEVFAGKAMLPRQQRKGPHTTVTPFMPVVRVGAAHAKVMPVDRSYLPGDRKSEIEAGIEWKHAKKSEIKIPNLNNRILPLVNKYWAIITQNDWIAVTADGQKHPVRRINAPAKPGGYEFADLTKAADIGRKSFAGSKTSESTGEVHQGAGK